MIQQQKEAATQTALTSAMVDAGCLWWFFWMQFVTATYYGLPWFGGPSGSIFAIRYYVPPEGRGCTVPELFLAASIGLSVLALGRCLVMSRGAGGRLRMMFLVLVSAALVVGFAWCVLSWRNIHRASLESYQSRMRGSPEHFALGLLGPEYLREQQESVGNALAEYHRYWNHQARPDPGVALFKVPDGFALIPAGSFQMGNAQDGSPDAPVREVAVRAFHIAKHEVTKALWDEVREWAVNHGYTGLSVGFGKSTDHPVTGVSWLDAVKWCNARSEKEGLTPCYGPYLAVMGSGVMVPVGNWAANGYRLPTEAEWEKAARGGLSGRRFPWGDTISHLEANFRNDGCDAYGMECYQTGPRGYHPIHEAGGMPYTSPVGSFPANGYGLFDMVGNLREWCWDEEVAGLMGGLRKTRGGSWCEPAMLCLIAESGLVHPDNTTEFLGFRVVRSAFPQE